MTTDKKSPGGTSSSGGSGTGGKDKPGSSTASSSGSSKRPVTIDLTAEKVGAKPTDTKPTSGASSTASATTGSGGTTAGATKTGGIGSNDCVRQLNVSRKYNVFRQHGQFGQHIVALFVCFDIVLNRIRLFFVVFYHCRVFHCRKAIRSRHDRVVNGDRQAGVSGKLIDVCHQPAWNLLDKQQLPSRGNNQLFQSAGR